MSDPQFFLKKSSNGNEIALTGSLAVGRSADSGIVLTEGKPSRNHARISLAEGAVWLEDLGSTNGTYVNGERLASKVKLTSGDMLRFDVEEFVFRMQSAAASDPDKTEYRPPQAKPAAEPIVPEEPKAQPKARVVSAPPKEPKVPAEPNVPAEPKPPAQAKPPAEAQVAAEANVAAEAKAHAAPKAPAVEKKQSESNVKSASSGAGEGPGWLFGEDKASAGNKTVFLTPKQLEEARKRHRHNDAAVAAPASISLPHLLIYDADGASPSIVELRIIDPNKRKWTVGSDEGRNIRLEREGVSGLHATIENAGKVWKVIDEISFCGTFVNGSKVMTSFLQSGDRIAFGPAQCEFRLPAGAASAASAASAAAAGAASSPGGARAAGTTPPESPRQHNLLLIAGAALVGTLLILAIWKWLS